MEKDIEGQVLEAIKEVLNFNDPKTVKASIILARIRTILGLKDLASAPDLYEALIKVKQLVDHPYSDAWHYLVYPSSPNCEDQTSLGDIVNKALAKTEGK